MVHGGAHDTAITLSAEATGELDALAELAPLHNPPAVAAVRALHALRPDLPAIACFDTAFHATMPAEASEEAIPAAWRERWDLRRRGFHGLSHAYAARRTAELLRRPVGELRIVTAHLGAGASLCAVDRGRSVDTTMGMTPVDGLVMATRSGSVDPGLLVWVQRNGGLGAAAVERALSHEAGLLGLSGRSGDLREVLAGADAGDERCVIAVGVYVHRLAGAVARMAAALGGLDALTFTGGVGEHSPAIRAATAGRLAFLGLGLDASANASASTDAVVSGVTAAATLVVTAREDVEIARAIRATLRPDRFAVGV